MNISASMNKKDVDYKAIMESIEFIKKHEVLIGIPEDTANRKDKKGIPINNAELLFIHTNGSPIKGIPARPVLEPAIKQDNQNQGNVSNNMKKAIDAALTGNKGAIMQALEITGMEGQNVARDFFTSSTNGFAPNKPRTIKQKGSDRPLIDTDEMRKSITYVVREVR